MSQQMQTNMASNQKHNNCNKTDSETNGSFLQIDLSADKTLEDKSCLQNTIASNVETSVESDAEMTISTSESSPLMNGRMEGKSDTNTVIEVVADPKSESSAEPTIGSESVVESEPIVTNGKPYLEISGEPIVGSDSVTKRQPIVESVTQSPKYIRKTSIEMLSKIWKCIEDKEWHKTADQMNKNLIKNMFNSFSIKLNDNKMKQIMETALNDKLVLIEESDNHIRYVPNFDPKLFGVLTNDWFCFECHSVRETEDLIDCKKCFKTFHSNCLKGDHKVPNLKEESFECLYCQRSAKLDPKVDRLSKAEINKFISFVINNLQLSYDSQMFDSYSIEDSEQNRVFIFKPMDVMMIRHKALTEEYDKLENAITDFKHFCHNYSVCKRDGGLPLKDFERRFNHEIKELKLCVDCYKYSSDISYDLEEDPHNWFTLVCDPPHELVFAKYGKYPFWPAKVIEMKAGGKQYDVRFFDAPDFSRAIVPLQRLRPIDGFEFEDEDNVLELPVKLMDKHIEKMRAKGVYFMPTVPKPAKRSAKKRPNTDPNGTERPKKRSKKRADN